MNENYKQFGKIISRHNFLWIRLVKTDDFDLYEFLTDIGVTF